MNNKTILAITGSVIAIFAFLIVIYIFTNNSQPTSNNNINIITSQDHITWSPAKKNNLIEYSDFQCPACKNFHVLINQMVASGSADAKIKNKVTFIYRDFPLFQLHQNAMTAAYAAEAAGKQNKFFEMADLLFNNQDNWANLPDPNAYFTQLAIQLKLDINQFKTDINSKETKDKVNKDLASGNQAGINSTPTFFLNGQKLDNIQSFDQFKSLLESL